MDFSYTWNVEVPSVPSPLRQTTAPIPLQACQTLADLAASVGLSTAQFVGLSKTLVKQYTTFDIRKRSGSSRVILAPSRELKRVQRAILPLLTPLVIHRHSSHGFIANRDIMSNAHGHVGRRNILNLDLANFFGSIHPGRVSGALAAPPVRLAPLISKAIARICTFANGLPQGAPTSPILANLVAWTLDRDLERIAAKNRCYYTRYADDITFSTNAPTFPIAIFDSIGKRAGGALDAAITRNGFTLNLAKTRFCSEHSRQTVTGLVTNLKTNIDRRFVREVRSALHSIERYGEGSAQIHFERRHHLDPAPELLYRVRGQVLFIGQVRGRGDSLYRGLAARLAKISHLLKVPVEPSLLERLERNVWVIESDKELSQGSGFWLEGVGLITNSHVVENDSVAFAINAPSDKYRVTVVARDDRRDLAILDIIGTKPVGLPRGDPSKLRQLSPLTVVGFPGYSPGADLMLKPAAYAGKKNRSGVKCFILDAGITAGGSGGPVLNSDGEVVGVAVTGGETLEASKAAIEYGVIPIDEIDALQEK